MNDVFNHQVRGQAAGMLEVGRGRVPDGLRLAAAMYPGVEHGQEQFGDGKYCKLGTYEKRVIQIEDQLDCVARLQRVDKPLTLFTCFVLSPSIRSAIFKDVCRIVRLTSHSLALAALAEKRHQFY